MFAVDKLPFWKQQCGHGSPVPDQPKINMPLAPTKNRILEEKTFPFAGYGVAGKLAQAWCEKSISWRAKMYQEDGATVTIYENKTEFRTDGGDFAEARWDWVNDAEDAAIVARVEGSW